MHKLVAAFLSLLLAALPCMAQQSSPASTSELPVPAGTTLSTVLTQQISSSATHSGDQIHVQLASPVVSGSQVAIPAGTYLQGTVNRITQQNNLVSLSLFYASLAFANGYVAKLSGPVELRSAEGWWQPAPNSRRGAALLPFFFAPAIGAGIGAAAGKDGTLTPGSMNGGNLTPGSLTASTRGRDAAIGFGIGAGIFAVGLALYLSSHYHGGPDFFFAAGAPINVVLGNPVSLDSSQVADAAMQPQSVPNVAPQPRPANWPDSTPSGICFGPATPATPPTIIPGTPAIGDSPGTPDIVIPGTPEIPGPMIPCT